MSNCAHRTHFLTTECSAVFTTLDFDSTTLDFDLTTLDFVFGFCFATLDFLVLHWAHRTQPLKIQFPGIFTTATT